MPDYKTQMADIQARQAAMKADMQKIEHDCPWPTDTTYGHTSRVVDTSRPIAGLPKDISKIWVDGCAVIGFSVDQDGNPADAQIASANPPGTGPAALEVVKQGAYARGDKPDAHFFIRIGLSHPPTGGSAVSSMLR